MSHTCMNYTSFESQYLYLPQVEKSFRVDHLVAQQSQLKKYILSLYSATTWALFFLLNIDYVMYDSYMTSFVMTHILWVIKSRFFNFLGFLATFGATTWVDRFEFFTEYRLRHVWLIYDVICYDSYLMSHKIPNFSIS